MQAGDLQQQLAEYQAKLRDAESQLMKLRNELAESDKKGKGLEIEIARLKAQLDSTSG